MCVPGPGGYIQPERTHALSYHSARCAASTYTSRSPYPLRTIVVATLNSMMVQLPVLALALGLVGSVMALPDLRTQDEIVARQNAPVCRPPCEPNEECGPYTDSHGNTRDLCYPAGYKGEEKE